MAQDWRDSDRQLKPRSFVASGEFWLGVVTVLLALALGVAVYARFLG